MGKKESRTGIAACSCERGRLCRCMPCSASRCALLPCLMHVLASMLRMTLMCNIYVAQLLTASCTRKQVRSR